MTDAPAICDDTLKAPFPWFGGKSRVALQVWSRFGDVRNYVEPFVGSAAMLLARPSDHSPGIETINDADGFVANFWRSLQAEPDAVAAAADWPVNENDLHARHFSLVSRMSDLRERLEGDPAYYDAEAAGWWVWGLCSWIGSGWCGGNGPWASEDGRLVKLPHLGDAGQGINRKRPHLGDAGQVEEWSAHLSAVMGRLADRLRRVRVCSGDWTRVVTPSVTSRHGLTAVFLDPPYADTAGRTAALYAVDSLSVAHAVREWAIDNGDDPRYRIALCGYEGEHAMPASWETVAWKAAGGMGNQSNGTGRTNAARERLWFSPHCIRRAVQDQRSKLPLEVA